MQDSHCQLNISKIFISKYWSIVLVIILTPILLGAILPILPTHDDWATTIKPDFNPFFIKERFLFYGYHWRPFDAIMGYILGTNPQVLYPALNHYCIVIGHATRILHIIKEYHHNILFHYASHNGHSISCRQYESGLCIGMWHHVISIVSEAGKGEICCLDYYVIHCNLV